MLEKIIFYSVISFVVTFAMSYLNKGASLKTESIKGEKVHLRMNKLYLIIGYVGVGIAIAFSIGTMFFYEPGLEILCGLIWLIMGGTGTACLVYYRNHKVVFDEEQFVVSNWKGNNSTFRWNEISSVKFKPISGYLKVKDLSKGSNIHSHLIGLSMFIDKLDELTEFKRNNLKLPFK